jgi:hypothetical protein
MLLHHRPISVSDLKASRWLCSDWAQQLPLNAFPTLTGNKEPWRDSGPNALPGPVLRITNILLLTTGTLILQHSSLIRVTEPHIHEQSNSQSYYGPRIVS